MAQNEAKQHASRRSHVLVDHRGEVQRGGEVLDGREVGKYLPTSPLLGRHLPTRGEAPPQGGEVGRWEGDAWGGDSHHNRTEQSTTEPRTQSAEKEKQEQARSESSSKRNLFSNMLSRGGKKTARAADSTSTPEKAKAAVLEEAKSQEQEEAGAAGTCSVPPGASAAAQPTSLAGRLNLIMTNRSATSSKERAKTQSVTPRQKDTSIAQTVVRADHDTQERTEQEHVASAAPSSAGAPQSKSKMNNFLSSVFQGKKTSNKKAQATTGVDNSVDADASATPASNSRDLQVETTTPQVGNTKSATSAEAGAENFAEGTTARDSTASPTSGSKKKKKDKKKSSVSSSSQSPDLHSAPLDDAVDFIEGTSTSEKKKKKFGMDLFQIGGKKKKENNSPLKEGVSTVKMSGSGRIHVCHACLA